MEECYQTINMSTNQSNPRRRGNMDIKWTVVVVVGGIGINMDVEKLFLSKKV